MTGLPSPVRWRLRQAGGTLHAGADLSSSELKEVKRLVDNGELMIEANDLGAVQLASEAGLPFVCGPAINAYNADVLRMLLKQGMQRWVMPVELSRDWLMQLNGIWAGSASSSRWRCSPMVICRSPTRHAASPPAPRPAQGQLRTACIDYPTGRLPAVARGRRCSTSTASRPSPVTATTWVTSSKGMEGLVDVVRLSPEGMETLTMLERFRPTNRDGPLPLQQEQDCNGYWRQIPGMSLVEKRYPVSPDSKRPRQEAFFMGFKPV